MRLLALLLAAAVVAPASVAQGRLTVAAAISLTDVLEALAPMHAARGGGGVRFNFGPSNALARQIAHGAPVDLFISADEHQMALAAAAGAIDETTRVDLLSNHLAVVTNRERPVEIPDARALAGGAVRRIAIGDPAAVPVGIYARQYLEKLGVWGMLQPKLVPVRNARAAVAAVEHGTVDAAVVYESDTVTAALHVAFVVTGADAPRIRYPAAVLTSSRRHDEAARFLRFLCGAEAAAVFRQHKFVPLGCGVRP